MSSENGASPPRPIDAENVRLLPLQRYCRVRLFVQAARIDGPFQVRNADGLLACPDGYVVLDSAGQPHHMSRHEFERSYSPDINALLDALPADLLSSALERRAASELIDLGVD